MKLREWPITTKISEWTTAVRAHSRGLSNLSGDYAFSRAPGASWFAAVSVPPMRTADALKFRAFLHSLRGKSGTFWFTPPAVPPTFIGQTCTGVGGYAVYSDCTTYSDGTTHSDGHTGSAPTVYGTTAAIAADANSMVVTGFSSGRLVVGDMALIGSGAADQRQLVRITAVSGTTLTFAPRARRAVASGEMVQIGAVAALFRLAGQTPAVPLVVGRSEAMTLEIEEAY